jgi:glycerol-3-phosphate dehydrogenase
VSQCSYLTADRRARELAALAETTVDLLVVGGGVTGAGVALDAATRGLSVALIERRDLATGTSRWSSKLVHGGVRYLASGQVAVAWESALERAILAGRTAPHLVRALPWVTPLTPDLPRFAAAGTAGVLRCADALRAAARHGTPALARSRRISSDEALMWAPGLARDGLRGGLLSWDCQLEDDARLVIALARTAAAHGARVITYASALRLDRGGADVRDEVTGAQLRVAARHVINAAGVWAGGLQPSVALRPSRGSHLLVRGERLGSPRAAVSVPLPSSRGRRFAFAVPRADGLVLVGLTDEPHDAAPSDAPEVTPAEERTLLTGLRSAFEVPLAPADVVGRYAGLRPLVAGSAARTADLSRRHALVEDPDTGVLAVVGGKLTTYRRMAQDAVDRIAARPGVDAGPCRTARLPLVGAGLDRADTTAGPRRIPRPPRVATSPSPTGAPSLLMRRYGSEAGDVAALAAGDRDLIEPVAPGVPALGVELLWAVRAEGALTVEDVVERRTRAGLIPAWADAVRAAAAQHDSNMTLAR